MAITVVLLLSVINYGLETTKWKMLARLPGYSYSHYVKAFLSGCTISVFMPFRTGEYLGRIIHFPRKEWSRVIVSSVRSGLLQLLMTLLVGVLCTLAVIPTVQRLLAIPYIWAVVLSVLGMAGVVWAFTHIQSVLLWVAKRFQLGWSTQHPQETNWKAALALSALRYLTFLIQYVILFYSMGISSPVVTIGLIPVFLLIQTVVPTFFLSEVGLRVVVCSYLFASSNAVMPIFTIYVVNVLLPALAGLLFIVKWRS